jgi:predicted DNA-binding antitoxin AbrB/MazE fold protein
VSAGIAERVASPIRGTQEVRGRRAISHAADWDNPRSERKISNKNLAFKGISADFSFMSFTGTIENGVVKIPPDISLPEGAKVRVEPLSGSRRHLVDKLRAIAQSMPDMPADWAAQHDHYLHGTPKK